MTKRSDIRRLAMQALYQIDVRGEADREAIREAVIEDAKGAKAGDEAFALADAAWGTRAAADAMALALAPDWPTHRQPPVDRAILRLAYHEMASGRAPKKVAINEAVELAKAFCGENSPSFINGVLDKMARAIGEVPAAAGQSEETQPMKPSADAWLADAMKDAPPTE